MTGAGPAGGVLFLAVLLFVGWLVATDTAGVQRIVLLALIGIGVIVLGANVARRR